MVSDRIQRRIDAFLDEADEAATAGDWTAVAEKSRAVLAIDPGNEDALAFQQMAGAATGTQKEPAAETRSIRSPAIIPEPPHPETFVAGRYRVERFLGDGAKKRVFLARDNSLDRLVAFAQLRIEGLDSLGRQRLIREAQAMARLGNHPRLVAIHDIGEESGTPFIVEEYMAGGDLADQLREAEGGLPLRQVLAIGQSVCEALSFIHEKQLLHRDLKPSNVFLAEDGSAKVGDFGLAVSLDRSRLTTESSMIGTPSYMPPEQALGGAVTEQSDLYSLGAMLYELTTGRPPFVGDDPTSVISQHINTRPVAPSWYSEHCPPELEAVILQCLEKVPADRPGSANEVREALSRVDPAGKSSSHSGSSANPLDRLAQGVFVGRGKELERLRTAFDNAFAGHGNLILLVGEPGIGKTRTSKEIETYARMRGAQVLVGKTHESAGMPAYWPWVEVGRSWSEQNSRDFTLLQPTLGDQGRELRRIFPELAQLAPNIEAPEEISDPESAQFRLFDAYTTFVRAMAEHRPLLIVLDDLHWADRPTLMLLQHMARTLARMRVLVVGTYRDTDVVRASALSETLANLNREPGFERIVLRGLERQEVEAYIRATANVNVSPSLIQRIHEETEGIPFFLSEVVNLMAEEGTLSADSSLEVALPDGVKEALGRRLDRLSPEANELLQVASVAGREFRHDTLLALGDHTEDQLFALLEEGLDARVIEEEGQAGRYRFTHALMQETLLDELSTTRKVRLHGRIGDALESRWGDRAAERATRLAEHFVEAATLSDQYAERAFRYARLAAEQAERQAAWGEAARQYEACLTLLAETESDINGDEAGLYFAAGRCHRYAYAHRDAWRRFMRARDLYDEAGNAPAVADVVLESLSVFGGRDRKLILAADALSKLGDDDPHRQGKLLGFLANQGSDSRDEYRPHALEIAERHGFSDVRGWLRVGDMFVLEAEGRYVEAAEEVHTAIAEADAAGDIGLGSTVRMWRFFQLIPLGDVHAARQAAEESIEYARQHHLLFEEENAVGYLAALEFALCRFDTFEELLDRYAGATTFLFGLLRAEWAFMRGDPQNARRLAPAPDYVGGQAPLEAFLWAKHARYQLASGEDEGAAVAFGRMRGRMADIPGARIVGGIPLDSLTLTAAGEALTELAEPEFVRACFDFYVTQTSVAALSRMGDSESLAFGNIALAVREHGAALSAFSDALGWAEANGADIITGRCHLGLAELAEREGSPTDALSHLDAAAQLFQKHGAKLYLDQALQKKLELQGISNADVRSSILVVSSVVEAEKPSLTQQAAPDGTVTLMFSDIVDSTPLNERLGDAAWMALLREHSTIVESEVAEHRGHVVKSMGDGFMVAFPSARDGLRCAIALQRALADRNDSTDQPLEARIGLHTGEAVRDRGDFFGKHVNLAARIGASAAGGEIVVSSLLAQIVEPSGEFVLEAREARAFKGLEGEHVTYGVGWS